MTNESTILLDINNEMYTGWETFQCEFDMESLVSTFTFGLHDKQGDLRSIFETGLNTKVYIRHPLFPDIKIIDGYITSTDRSISGMSTSFDINGTDKLTDLVDCSVPYLKRTWRNRKFTAIIKDLIAPFNIELIATDLLTDPTIDKFSLQTGETVFNSIERLCRSEAVLPLSNYNGDLVLSYSAPVGIGTIENLEVGKNILSLTESISWEDRYSEYVGVSQVPGNGRPWTKAMLQAKHTATDAGVSRYRPMVFVAESKSDRKTLGPRVNWEAQIRAGRAREYSVVVSGFFQNDSVGNPKQLWEKNKRVTLIDEHVGLTEELLITKVLFELTSGGEKTTLTLMHPDTFKQDPSDEIDLTPR